MALKELEVRHAAKRAKDYKLADGEGLYLLVRANGSKLWRFKYRFGGKEKLLSFGMYPGTSLADARLRRAETTLELGKACDHRVATDLVDVAVAGRFLGNAACRTTLGLQRATPIPKLSADKAPPKPQDRSSASYPRAPSWCRHGGQDIEGGA